MGSPTVTVPKSDGVVQLCGDYKVTVNPVLDVDQYPLPCPEDLMSSLTVGLKFDKLDLTSAYQQMLLDEAPREYVTINTHCGLYRYTRLPFGIASSRRPWIAFCRSYSMSFATSMTSWSPDHG